MSDNYTPEEITALIHGALGLQIQKPKPGLIAIEDDGTNPAVQEWTVPVKIDGQEETYYAKWNPVGVDETALANNSPVNIELNYEGEYEVTGLNPILGRSAYSGVTPTPNFVLRQHNHQNGVGGGQLAADLVFDSGAVQAIYGGTGQSVYAVGDLLYASTTTALSKLVVGTDGHVLTLVAGLPAWAAVAASGGWTDDGTVVRLTTSTDSVAIGTNTNNSAKLYILEDDPDEIPLRIKAAAAQAFPVFYVEDNSGNIFFNIGATGQVSVNSSETAGGAFIANGTSGTTLLFADASANILYIGGAFVFNEAGDNTDARFEGDNDANLLVLDASTDRVGIGDATPDGRFAVVGRADEAQTIIRGNATQTSNIFEIQDSASNVQVSVSGLGAAVFNEEGNDADFRIESDTQANAFFLDGTNGAIQQLGNAPAAYLHMAASTTSLASYRVPAGTAPSSPGEGDGYNSSTIKSMGLFVAGVWQYVPGRIFTATANAGPSNTTAETSIVGSGIGTITLPANFFTAGKVYEFDVDGMYSTDGTSRDIQVRIKLGSTTIGDATLISTANAVNGGRTFRIRYRIRCVTTGASGTMQGQGMMWGQNVQQGFNTDGTVTVDTTGTLAAAATADFVTSNANCHFTSNILTVRAIN